MVAGCSPSVGANSDRRLWVQHEWVLSNVWVLSAGSEQVLQLNVSGIWATDFNTTRSPSDWWRSSGDCRCKGWMKGSAFMALLLLYSPDKGWQKLIGCFCGYTLEKSFFYYSLLHQPFYYSIFCAFGGLFLPRSELTDINIQKYSKTESVKNRIACFIIAQDVKS